MSRILKRPMFRKGGSPNKGIMTGLVDRKKYAEDGFVTPEGQRAFELIPDIKNIVSKFTPKTKLPIGTVGARIALGEPILPSFLKGYGDYTKADDVRTAGIDKTALSLGLTQAMKVPKKGFKVLTKEEVEKDYPQLDPTKAYKKNLDNNDIIAIGKGDTIVNLGNIKKQSKASMKEKSDLGYREADDVILVKDNEGNVVDSKLLSSEDKRMGLIGKAVKDSKLQEADDALRELENYIVLLQKQGKENLPGIGFFGGRTGPLSTREGKKVRALLAAYENITLKKRSGAAVTPSELARVQNELAGSVTTSDESVFLDILKTNRKILEKQKKATFALYRDSDLQEYQKRGGLSLYETPIGEQSTEELMKQLEE